MATSLFLGHNHHRYFSLFLIIINTAVINHGATAVDLLRSCTNYSSTRIGIFKISFKTNLFPPTTTKTLEIFFFKENHLYQLIYTSVYTRPLLKTVPNRDEWTNVTKVSPGKKTTGEYISSHISDHTSLHVIRGRLPSFQ